MAPGHESGTTRRSTMRALLLLLLLGLAASESPCEGGKQCTYGCCYSRDPAWVCCDLKDGDTEHCAATEADCPNHPQELPWLAKTVDTLWTALRQSVSV